jgi:hypothetical protein
MFRLGRSPVHARVREPVNRELDRGKDEIFIYHHLRFNADNDSCRLSPCMGNELYNRVIKQEVFS